MVLFILVVILKGERIRRSSHTDRDDPVDLNKQNLLDQTQYFMSLQKIVATFPSREFKFLSSVTFIVPEMTLNYEHLFLHRLKRV